MEIFERAGRRGVGGEESGVEMRRVATGEVVCAWAWTVSMKKAGKFRWVVAGAASGGGWGEEAELMVLITLLAVVERIRRDENNNLRSG